MSFRKLLISQGLEIERLQRHLYHLKATTDKGRKVLLYPTDSLIEKVWARRIAGVIVRESSLGVFLPTRGGDGAPTLIKGGLKLRRRSWEPKLSEGLDYPTDEPPRDGAIREFREETGYDGDVSLSSGPPVTILYRAMWEDGQPRPGIWPCWGWVIFFYGTVSDPVQLENSIPEPGLKKGRWYNPGVNEADRQAIQQMRWWQRALLLEVDCLNLPW
jgi:ADP-ribose pyrophosphatase YjhB (NUDIX family)